MNNISMKFQAFIYILFLFLATSYNLNAAGLWTHIIMTDKAISYVKNDQLKSLLIKNKNAVLNGSFFPDTGFRSKNRYGEFSHWNKFQNEYLKIIIKNNKCIPPNLYTQKNCSELLAHFMGALAHSIEDVNFDRYFVRSLANLQFKGSLSKAQYYTDYQLDFVILWDQRYFKFIPSYLPSSSLISVYKNLEFKRSITKENLQEGHNWVRMALIGIRLLVTRKYILYKTRSPWASQNYYEAKGGILDSAQKVALLWDQLWSMLEKNQWQNLPKMNFRGGWPDVDYWLE